MTFWSEQSARSAQQDSFLDRYSKFPEPVQVKGKFIVEELEKAVVESLVAGRPDHVLSWLARIFAWRRRAEISQGTWLNLQERLESLVAAATAPEWRHLTECLRATLCHIHVPLSALVSTRTRFDFDQDGWNRRIAATLLPDWSTRYRSALLFFVAELFPDSETEEKALLAEQAGHCRIGAAVLEPPSRVTAREWPRLLTFLARVATRVAPTAGALGQLAESLGEKTDAAEIELLLHHWAANCPICCDLLELWCGELWPRAVRPEPPIQPAPGGPELDVLLAGLPGAGKTSLLFALESEGLIEVVPLRPQRAPGLNPFRAGSASEIQVAELREAWESGHPEATTEARIQARPQTSRQLVFPNFLDLPGASFALGGAGGPPWLGVWRERRPPSCMVLLFRFEGDGALGTAPAVSEALCRIPEQMPAGRPIYLVAGSLDLAGLAEGAMDALNRPFTLLALPDGRTGLLPAEHRELSRCLPALRKVSHDLARLAENGLATKILARAGAAPTTLVYACLRHEAGLQGRRHAGCQALWQTLTADLAKATAARRRAWLKESFVDRPKTALAAIADFRESLENLLTRLRGLEAAVRAVVQVETARLPESIGCLATGNFEEALRRLESWQLPEGNLWYSYERSLAALGSACREATSRLLVLLGVAGVGAGKEGFVIAEPMPLGADPLRAVLELPLSRPRKIEISLVEGVLATGCKILDGGPGTSEFFGPLIGAGSYRPLQLLDLEPGLARALLEEMIASVADGPFAGFGVRRRELDPFHLEALAAMKPGDLPPVEKLLDSFALLARLWRWSARSEEAWRSSKILWLKRWAAAQVKQRLGGSKQPTPEELADAESWSPSPVWRRNRQEKEKGHLKMLKGLLSTQSENQLLTALNDDHLYGQVRGMLKDLATAHRVAGFPEVARAEIDLDVSRQTELQDALRDLEVASVGNGTLALALTDYARVIRNERATHLRISGWLDGQTQIALDSPSRLEPADWLSSACFGETSPSPEEAR